MSAAVLQVWDIAKEFVLALDIIQVVCRDLNLELRDQQNTVFQEDSLATKSCLL